MTLSISDRVITVLAAEIGRTPEPTESVSVIGDSFDVVEAVMELEEEFLIELPDDDVEACATIGDVVALVERVVAGREPADLQQACAGE